ncbi:MAG TPA: GvpL/GvpF family gas vesicle protein [Solirubrobacteraceae bacterium]
MIYLYGITGRMTDAIDGIGLDVTPLQTEEVGALTAVYSTHKQLPVRADADLCWAHEAAVEAVMRRQAVLPARFGTTFPDLDELRSALLRDAEPLHKSLTEIDGCVELAVRINPLGCADGELAANGQEYLQDRLSEQRRREALAKSTLACLQEFAVASCLAASQSGQQSVSISYLVKTGGVERFSRAVGRLQKRWPEFGLSCTGPWAPYSFVANSTGAAA